VCEEKRVEHDRPFKRLPSQQAHGLAILLTPRTLGLLADLFNPNLLTKAEA